MATIVSCEFREFFCVSRLGPHGTADLSTLPRLFCHTSRREIILAKSSSAKGGEKEVARSAAAIASATTSRSITISAAGGLENRYRSISACTDQKMIASQNASIPRPFGRSWTHLGEKQRANASWPTSVTRNATFEAEALSSMRSRAPFYDSYEHKSRLAPRNSPMRKT